MSLAIPLAVWMSLEMALICERPEAAIKRRCRFTWLVPTIFAANLVLFIETIYINNCSHEIFAGLRGLGRFSVQPLKEIILLGSSPDALIKMGALNITKIVDEHQSWRLVTNIWLHHDVEHLRSNMICLFIYGFPLERNFGFVKVGLLYVISGIGGSLLSALFIGSEISVGASGAIFGLQAGMVSQFITNWTIYEHKWVPLFFLCLIIGNDLAEGIGSRGVDNFAHIGGLVTGFLLGFILLILPQFGYMSKKDDDPIGPPRSQHNKFQYALWFIAAILLFAGFNGGLIMVFRGVNGYDNCHWCHHLRFDPHS